MNFRMLPGLYTMSTLSPEGTVYWKINNDGTFTYIDETVSVAATSAVYSGAGTYTLNVLGSMITIDATALANTYCNANRVFSLCYHTCTYTPTPATASVPFSFLMMPGNSWLYTGTASILLSLKNDGMIKLIAPYDVGATGTGTQTVTVLSDITPLSSSSIATNVTSYGGNNGAIDVAVSNGSTPYSFLWNDGATTEDRSSLIAGNYSCTITDANGCTSVIAVTITQPTAFPITLDFTAIAASFPELQIGIIDDAINTFLFPYTSAQSSLMVNLLPGSYRVHSTGYMVNTYFQVTSNGTIAYSLQDEAAYDGFGTSILTAIGFNINIDISAIRNAYPASEIRFGNLINSSCTNPMQPNIMTFRMLPSSVQLNFCNPRGNIFFIVNNDGTVSYADPAQDAILDGAGTNTLVVQGSNVTIDATALSNTHCGSIYRIGSEGYMANWINSSIPTTLLMLSSDLWVYARESNGSTSISDVNFSVGNDGNIGIYPGYESLATGSGTHTLSFTTNMLPLSASATAGTITSTGGSTTVTVSASNGTPPYSGTGTFTVTAGTYSYTITDAKGCTSIVSVTVTEPANPLLVSIGNLSTSNYYTCAFGTGANLVIGYGSGPTSVTLNGSATGGSPAYSYSWSPADGLSNPNVANPVFSPNGTTGCANNFYTLTVTDANGTTATAEVNVTVAYVKGIGGNVNKVKVCHSTSTQEIDIEVSINAVPTHLGHGDCLGDCQDNCDLGNRGAFILEEPVGSGELSVYPNPGDGQFLLDFIPVLHHAPIGLSIMDAAGRVVYEKIFDATVELHLSVDLQDILSTGFYSLKIINGEYVFLKKLGVRE